MNRVFLAATIAACALLAPSLSSAASPEIGGKSQASLTAAAQANKFCFLLFYKANDAATQAAGKIVSQGVTKRSDRAAMAYVNVSDPQEQAIVQRFDVARAPMPFLLAVAPNGAITCVYPKDFQEADLDAAFVTPTMTRVMKSIQDGKLVLLYVHPAGVTHFPEVVTNFSRDALYSQRSAIVPLRLNDAAETRFLKDLKIDAAQTTDTIVFLAPPGVMVGKYPSTTTVAKLAADLHAAGKCCTDPNCKHSHK